MSEQMTVKFETLLNGYTAAHSRFVNARSTRDNESTFHPLFEALNWAVAMDDYIDKHWNAEDESIRFGWRNQLEHGEQETVKGIRFARNRVHHQWANALQLKTGGIQAPIVAPIVTHEWAWKSADEIPLASKDQDNRNIHEYRSTLQGRLVRLSLSALERAYWKMASEHLE